jgi:hypothetical protein
VPPCLGEPQCLALLLHLLRRQVEARVLPEPILLTLPVSLVALPGQWQQQRKMDLVSPLA